MFLINFMFGFFGGLIIQPEDLQKTSLSKDVNYFCYFYYFNVDKISLAI